MCMKIYANQSKQASQRLMRFDVYCNVWRDKNLCNQCLTHIKISLYGNFYDQYIT